jgi:hypothetical protein
VDLSRVPGLKPIESAYFDNADPEDFLQQLNALVGPSFIQVPASLAMPRYYQRQPGELLKWLEAIDAHVNLKSAFDHNVRDALNTYKRNRVPAEYVETMKKKRHPIRGAGQIADYYSHGVSAEYAAECDWSFKTDIIKQFEMMGIPAEWTVKLSHMSYQAEWVEAYWQARMDIGYALALWKTNLHQGANCGHHSIVGCWEAEVPLAYAEQTAPWLAPEDVIAGWEAGVPAEYLLETLQP